MKTLFKHAIIFLCVVSPAYLVHGLQCYHNYRDKRRPTVETCQPVTHNLHFTNSNDTVNVTHSKHDLDHKEMAKTHVMEFCFVFKFYHPDGERANYGCNWEKICEREGTFVKRIKGNFGSLLCCRGDECNDLSHEEDLPLPRTACFVGQAHNAVNESCRSEQCLQYDDDYNCDAQDLCAYYRVPDRATVNVTVSDGSSHRLFCCRGDRCNAPPGPMAPMPPSAGQGLPDDWLLLTTVGLSVLLGLLLLAVLGVVVARWRRGRGGRRENVSFTYAKLTDDPCPSELDGGKPQLIEGPREVLA